MKYQMGRAMMNDFEQEVRHLWDKGYLIPEIAKIYGMDEEVIADIIEAPGNYVEVP